MQVHAGIDIGGTGTRIVILGRDGGAVLAQAALNTADLAAGTRTAKLARLADAVLALVPAGASLRGLGIGASGPVDRVRGTIANPDTLPGFTGFRLAASLESLLGVPALLDNDAVVAAIAEQRMGAGKGSKRMLLVGLGTGIGVALIVEGHPFRGPAGAHPEGGHFPIGDDPERCYCGINGCWEHLASRTALQRMLKPLLPAAINNRDIIGAAAQRMDRDDVRQAFFAYGALVGRGLLSLQALYLPDTIVIGGSAAEQFALIEAGVLASVTPAKWFSPKIAILPSVLGDTAGAIGAALIARERA